VPQRAVTEIQGKYLVAVVGADNKVDIRPVTVGERIGSDWIISRDCSPASR
jgi:membrane fusion protein (multidrug efflux system)